jgi:hypothetical protein
VGGGLVRGGGGWMGEAERKVEAEVEAEAEVRSPAETAPATCSEGRRDRPLVIVVASKSFE